jgi:hypothetical protein
MKYEEKSRHRYEVQAERRVLVPQYGPTAYYIDRYEEEFPYGKGKEYATGKAARLAALDRVNALTPVASSVLLVQCNGYSGFGEYMKQSDQRFTSSWADLEAA